MQKERAYIAHLAGLARLGDRAAFERLVKYFSPRLFAHAFRLLRHREKMSLMSQIRAVRILRELGRVELQILHRAGGLQFNDGGAARSHDEAALYTRRTFASKGGRAPSHLRCSPPEYLEKKEYSRGHGFGHSR